MQDCYLYIVAKGKEILGQAESREDALGYIHETYGEESLKASNYEPRCQGQLEEWKYGDSEKIRVIMVCKETPSITDMLETADVEREVRIPKPMKPVKNTATTPTRTRLVPTDGLDTLKKHTMVWKEREKHQMLKPESLKLVLL